MVLQKKISQFGQNKRKNLAPEPYAEVNKKEKGHQEDINQQQTDII